MDISKIFVNTKLNNNSPRYLQIAKIISNCIHSNTLLEGTKLPSERELALLFKVSRTTAINSYRYLERENLVVTKKGSGTFVAKNPAQINYANKEIPWKQIFRPYTQTSISSLMHELLTIPTGGETISLDAGMPDPQFYPLEKFQEIFNQHYSTINTKFLGHIPIEGLDSLKESLVHLLLEKGIRANSDNILVTSGSQQGIYLLAKAIIEPGDYVIVESPTYVGALQVFQAAGAKILALPGDKSLNLNILEDYLIRYRPKLFYTIPTFQNPSGRVISHTERQQLIDLASRHRLLIIEDDPYSEFYYEEKPPRPIKALNDYEGIIYLSTFSKILIPGLRLGYVAAHPALISRLTMEKQYIDLHSNNLSQWLLSLYLAKGELKGHLTWVREQYKVRRDALYQSLTHFLKEDLYFTLPSGGFYIWCKILPPIKAHKLLQKSLKEGVSFVPGNAFDITSSGKEFRLCFTSNNTQRLEEAVFRLSKAFKQASRSQITASEKNIKPLI